MLLLFSCKIYSNKNDNGTKETKNSMPFLPLFISFSINKRPDLINDWFFHNGQNFVIQFTFLNFTSKLWVLLQELGWRMQIKVDEALTLHLMKVQIPRRCRKPKSYKLRSTYSIWIIWRNTLARDEFNIFVILCLWNIAMRCKTFWCVKHTQFLIVVVP